jgi:polyisoprenoid-binding protein YceI
MKMLALLIIFIGQLNFAKSEPVHKWFIDLNKSSGSVEFIAIGRPSALKIKGKGEKAKGMLEIEGSNLTGTASFPLDSLDTGIKLRNEHMKKKYLETEKYPEVKFTFTKANFSENFTTEKKAIEKFPFEGKLLLHGVERPVTGTAIIEKKGKEMEVAAEFELKISDFGITSPEYVGITMAKEVQVQVQFNGPYTNVQ